MKEQLLEFYKKHERYQGAAFFVLGFLVDVFTLGDVDNITSILQQGLYIGLAGLLLRWHFLESEGLWVPPSWLQKAWPYRIEVLHFLLGGLLSVYTLFFFVSSSLATSAVFLILMATLLILNEFPQFKELGLIFKYCLYAICLFSFFLFLLPVVLGGVGFGAFLLSMLLGGVFIFLNYWDLCKFGVVKLKAFKQILVPSLVTLGVFLMLYIFKILPPAPLAAQYTGVFHSIRKMNDEYILGYNRPFWKFWENGDQTFYAKPGDKIHVFARIFAPGSISEKTYFHWQLLQKEEWISSDKVLIALQGGRRQGFRAYATKANFEAGAWRVKIETEDGREISRINFEVIQDLKEQPRDMKYSIH
jgi:hypothetical protein